MKRWQDCGEVQDSDDEEELELSLDSPSPERPSKRRKPDGSSDEHRPTNSPVGSSAKDTNHRIRDADEIAWLPQKVANTYGRKGKLVQPTQKPTLQRRASVAEQYEIDAPTSDIFDVPEDADELGLLRVASSPGSRLRTPAPQEQNGPTTRVSQSPSASLRPSSISSHLLRVSEKPVRSGPQLPPFRSPVSSPVTTLIEDDSDKESRSQQDCIESLGPVLELPVEPSFPGPADETPGYMARRSLRARKEIQLHPYMIDKAKYQRQCRERGLRPVRLLDQEPVAQGSEDRPASASSDGEHVDDAIQSSSSASPASVSRRSIAYVNTGVMSEFDYFTRANEHSDSDANSEEPVLKRKKTSSTAPPSPPSSRGTPLGTQSQGRKPVPIFRYPRNISSPSLPTPQISSEIRPSMAVPLQNPRNRNASSVGSSQGSRSSSPAKDSPSDFQSDVEDDSQDLRLEKKRIRGVLPASWLRIDMRAKQKSHLSAGRPSDEGSAASPDLTPQRLRGVARRITSSTARDHGAAFIGFATDDGHQSDDSVRLSEVGPAQPRFDFRSTQSNAAQQRYDDEIMEHDTVDAMLANRSHSVKSGPDRRRIKKHTATATVARKERAVARVSPADDHGSRSPRGASSSWGNTRLSIEDAPHPPSAQGATTPLFIRLAVRRARQAPNMGRHTADRKVIDLASDNDTTDALAVLRAWQQGAIVPRSPLKGGLQTSENAQLRSAQCSHRRHGLVNRKSATVGLVRPSSGLRPGKRRSRLQIAMRQSTIEASMELNRSVAQDTCRQVVPTVEAPNVRSSALTSARLRTAQLESLQHDYEESHRTAIFDRRVRVLTENVAARDRRPLSSSATMDRYIHEASNEAILRPIQPSHKTGRVSMGIGRKPRKGKARRLRVSHDHYIHLREDLNDGELLNEDDAPSAVPSGPVLQGLPPFGASFTTNFGVRPPEREERVCNDPLIAKGELHELLDLARRNLSRPQGHIQLCIDDQLWNWHAWDEQVAAQLQQIPTIISTVLQSSANGDSAISDEQHVDLIDQNISYILGSVVKYCSRCLYLLDPVDRSSCVQSLNSYLRDLAEVVTEFQLRHDGVCKILVQLLQFIVVTACQAVQISNHMTVADDLQARSLETFHEAAVTLARLITPGHVRDMQMVNSRGQGRDPQFPHDSRVGTYSSSLVILNHTTRKCGDQQGFWSAVSTVFTADIEGMCTLADFEEIWRKVFLLLPIFSIDDLGLCHRQRLFEGAQENWALVRRLIARVFQLYGDSSKVRGHTVNGYLRALLSRCHELINIWGWRKCDSIIFDIYDFFSGRHLALLHNEEVHGSPKFLEALGTQPSLDIAASDSSFQIFLKIVATGILGMRQYKVLEDRKIGSNITWRLIPSHGRTYVKDGNMQQTDLDALRNHHDLLCTLYYASPPENRPGVSLLRNLVDHSSSHREACRVNVRAWTILTAFQAASSEPLAILDDLIAWYMDIMTSTISQYRLARSEVEQDAATAPNEGARDVKDFVHSTIAQNQLKIAGTMIEALAGLGKAMQNARSIEVLSRLVAGTNFWLVLELFDPSQRRLRKTLLEALSVVNTALDVQRSLTNSVNSQILSEDSQEFGDSKALNELVASETTGIAAGSSVAQTLFQPLAELVSNVFGADAFPNDEFAQSVIDTWVRTASDLVDHGAKSWLSYIDEYSSNSWKQLRSTRQARVFMPYFISRVVEHAARHSEVRQHVLTAWLLSLADREANLRFQHVLTSALLNAYDNEPLIQNLPFAMDPISEQYRITLQELKYRRLMLISSVLCNMREALIEVTGKGYEKTAAMRCLFRGMLHELMHFMKTNYQDLQASDNQDIADDTVQGNYVCFVQQIVSYLQQHTADFCQVDKFFTDSGAFPLPATDPTYVVGKLKSYVPKLCDARARKDLAIFIQSVSERAAVDGQQQYLVGQMAIAMNEAVETGKEQQITLRGILLTTIFPAYIDAALNGSSVCILLLPMMVACQKVVAEAAYQDDQNDQDSLSGTITAILISVARHFQAVKAHPGHLANAAVLEVTAAMCGVYAAALSYIVSTMHRPDIGGNELMQLARLHRSQGTRLTAYMLNTSEIDADPDFIGILSSVDVSWLDTKAFTEKHVEEAMKNWHCTDGQYYVRRGGMLKKVPVRVGDFDTEQERLLEAIKGYNAAFDSIFEPRRRQERAAIEDICELGSLLI